MEDGNPGTSTAQIFTLVNTDDAVTLDPRLDFFAGTIAGTSKAPYLLTLLNYPALQEWPLWL